VTPRTRVLVSLGTDHHPFERLLGWVERWASTAPEGCVVVVQHGFSRVPVGVEAHELLPPDRLRGLMAEADAVVVQGGPGGIIDSLTSGRRPIVVPRQSGLGEHVDDHQVAFARHMARLGYVTLAETEADLVGQLDAALTDPSSVLVTPYVPASTATASRIGEIVDQLVAR
jgi:UDP-N-acetylglucosamine transferase subunit ALG13